MLSAIALGFLHGLGADHLMAIAALSAGTVHGATATGVSRQAHAFRVAIRFALGHAVLLALGSIAVLVLGWNIPVVLERFGEIAGGTVLVALGALGLWIVATRRIYGHSHAHGLPPRTHWHLHIGRRDRHPLPAMHSHVPGILGAVFALSGLRALTLIAPIDAARDSIGHLMALVGIFALGILLSMSLFGVVLARVTGSTRVPGSASRLAAAATALASIALGIYWIARQI